MRPYRHLLLFLPMLAAVALWVAAGLPWWGKAVLVFGVILALAVVGQSLMRVSLAGALAEGLDETSKALRGACVIVHRVTVADPPGAEAAPAESQSVCYVAVELTVTPSKAAGGNSVSASDEPASWEPSNFTLVSFESAVDADAPALTEANGATELIATVESAEMLDQERAGSTGPASGGTAKIVEEELRAGGWLVGRHRVRLVFEIPAGMPPRVRLRYLLEEFGEVDLPR